MNKDMWTLQSKNRLSDYWGNILMAVPFSEITQHVDTMLSGYRAVGRQHYFRAYCLTSDVDDMSWQALPDFPEFNEWIEVGRVAKMTDGSIWQLT